MLRERRGGKESEAGLADVDPPPASEELDLEFLENHSSRLRCLCQTGACGQSADVAPDFVHDGGPQMT